MDRLQSTLVPLQVKGLEKKVGDFTLHADFSVGIGQRVSLQGKSGSGKTTLLRILSGLEKLHPHTDQGQIFLGDEEMTHLPAEKRDVGFVFQDPALFSSLNVLENVTFGLKMKKVEKPQREALGFSYLEKVGLRAKAHSPIHKLSGGERQRVAFLRALIWKPRLILLDEPFTALDPALRLELHSQLTELHQIWPAPLVMVTHNPFDLKEIATHQLILEWDPKFPIRRVRG